MANRAYLFSSDCNPDDSMTWVDLDMNVQHYYDSRHRIPVSWFFFFRPDDVNLVDQFSANGYLKDVSYWQEPKFMAGKQQAFDLFNQNQPLLSQIISTDFEHPAFADFIPSLHRLSGTSLCMDPREIAQDNEDDLLPLRRVLELITEKNTPVETVKSALSRFCRLSYKDEDDMILNVIGYTYGSY